MPKFGLFHQIAQMKWGTRGFSWFTHIDYIDFNRILFLLHVILWLRQLSSILSRARATQQKSASSIDILRVSLIRQCKSIWHLWIWFWMWFAGRLFEYYIHLPHTVHLPDQVRLSMKRWIFIYSFLLHDSVHFHQPRTCICHSQSLFNLDCRRNILPKEQSCTSRNSRCVPVDAMQFTKSEKIGYIICLILGMRAASIIYTGYYLICVKFDFCRVYNLCCVRNSFGLVPFEYRLADCL